MSNRLWPVKQVCIFALIAFASNFNYGFSTTYINTSVDEFKTFLNTSLSRRHVIMTEEKYDLIWNVFLNCWFIGSFFGVWINSIFSERFGRRGTIS